MQTDLPKPRDAASLLVLRHDAGTPQVLMARRSAGHRFMPNVLVFPGGAVDPADYDAEVATQLAPHVAARLERSADPALARALAVAATRELTEEVGLSLGRPPPLGVLEYLCRAITPPDRQIRFDARFFVVDAAHANGVLAGSDELADPDWYTVEAALAADIPLATRAVLGCFQKWLVAADRAGGQAVPVLRDREWSQE